MKAALQEDLRYAEHVTGNDQRLLPPVSRSRNLQDRENLLFQPRGCVIVFSCREVHWLTESDGVSLSRSRLSYLKTCSMIPKNKFIANAQN